MKYINNLKEIENRNYLIPSYQEEISKIKSFLVQNSSLSALYINCSKITDVEKHYGKKTYLKILNKIQTVILDMQGEQVRKEDIIVSTDIGSHEFFIFLSNKREDRDFGSTDIETLCDRISNWLNNSITPVTFSYLRGKPKIDVGYAVVIYNPLIREERLINKLMEDAKLMSNYQKFKLMMRDKEKLQELILKEAIRTVFQPIIRLSNNDIIGYEALTRGPEDTEYENPYILFDIANETDLMFELDRICRKKALQNAIGLKSHHKLFLNCLPSAVHDPEFKDAYLKSFLEDLKINPNNIVLEITEREAIENYNLFKEAIKYYADVGFAIAVDDMGAGYSSLETVVELQPSYIKIDISIVRDIDKNILKQELIKAILSLSNKMNAIVIAEGVETEDESKTLKQIGIDLAQGFLFAKPSSLFPDNN